ncbi:MAG: mechanosensitive ion channel family protein, partial [Chitinispirillaceae bacterium]
MDVFDLVGPNRAVSVFGIKLVGFTAENGRKLLLTIALFILLRALFYLLSRMSHRIARRHEMVLTHFWSTQALSILFTILFVLGFLSIWFDDPIRVTTALGLVTAGLAFALQKVVTAVAGYVIILRGKLFNVGDRISIGNVRGDVTQLNFTYTTIMEMGQPHSVQEADPAMWVEARQYTGRVVTITNDKVFENPVFNYTKEFPFIWEELHIMVPYDADLRKAEQIILNSAAQHTLRISDVSSEALEKLEQKYFIKESQLVPKVYFRITDNWLEMTVRFICKSYDIRDLKDAISRKIVNDFRAAGIQFASQTFDVVGIPPVEI